jgi:hypothetical protein
MNRLRAGDVFVLSGGAALLSGQVSWSRLAPVPIGGSSDPTFKSRVLAVLAAAR